GDSVAACLVSQSAPVLLGATAREASGCFGSGLLLGEREYYLGKVVQPVCEVQLGGLRTRQAREDVELIARQVLERAAAARVVLFAGTHVSVGDELVDGHGGASAGGDGFNDRGRARDAVAACEHIGFGRLHAESVDIHVAPLVEAQR